MKISNKLIKVDTSFTVNKYDNGYVFEVSGKNITDDWTSAKIICNTLEEVISLIKEYDAFQACE
jgi:hypothetical protein